MRLELNIYDERGREIVRTATGETCDIMLGTIEELMGILDIDTMKNNLELIKRVYGAYNEVKTVLSNIFEDVTEEEWKRVKLKELIPQLINLMKFTFLEMQGVPTDPKN